MSNRLAGSVTTSHMRRIDDAAIRRMRVPRLLLMEHAGLAVARAARALLGAPPQPLLVCCGLGFNGGDGLCAARHLAQWGYRPRVIVAGPARSLREEPAIFADMLRSLRVPIGFATQPAHAARWTAWWRHARVIVDALLGVGVSGAIRPLTARLIARMNRARQPILSVDIPSGLDADRGLPLGAAVRADVTVTFGWPKRGCLLADGPRHTGRLIVEPISLPRRALETP